MLKQHVNTRVSKDLIISPDSSQQNSARDVDNYSSNKTSQLESELHQITLRNMREDVNIENDELGVVEEFETEYKKSERSLTGSGLKSGENHSLSNIIYRDPSIIDFQDESVDENSDKSSMLIEKEVCYYQDPRLILEGKPFVFFSKNNKIQNYSKFEKFGVDIINTESPNQTSETENLDFKNFENIERTKIQLNHMKNLKNDVQAFMNNLVNSNNEKVTESGKSLWNTDKKYVEVTSAIERLFWRQLGKNSQPISSNLKSEINKNNEDFHIAKNNELNSDSYYYSNQSIQQSNMKSIHYLINYNYRGI